MSWKSGSQTAKHIRKIFFYVMFISFKSNWKIFLSKLLGDHLSCVWQLHTQKEVDCKEGKCVFYWLTQYLSFWLFLMMISPWNKAKEVKAVETWGEIADALSVYKFYRVSKGFLLALTLSHASWDTSGQGSWHREPAGRPPTCSEDVFHLVVGSCGSCSWSGKDSLLKTNCSR